MAASPEQIAEYLRRCKRIGLNPDAERADLVPDAHTNSLKRLAILTEVMVGKELAFDPIAASWGRNEPRPDWLKESAVKDD